MSIILFIPISTYDHTLLRLEVGLGLPNHPHANLRASLKQPNTVTALTAPNASVASAHAGSTDSREMTLEPEV